MTKTLRVVQGDDLDRQYKLADGEVVVGRDPSCQIVIPDDSVSRRHARLLVRNDTCLIEDLQSRNGTFVNGQKTEGRRRLANRDRVEIGVTAFEYQSWARRRRRIVPRCPAAPAPACCAASTPWAATTP